MILVDANLLVYAAASEMPKHEAARRWLDGRLGGQHRVGLPWESLLAFVRLVTNPRLFSRPAPIGRAWAQVERWLESEVAWIPAATERHRALLSELLPATGGQSRLVPDAHLAALAIGHGLTVYSADRDFARFPSVRWVDPLSLDRDPLERETR